MPGATLGNGYDTRPNLVGSLSVPNPGPAMWFKPAALAAPAPYTYGTSGMGVIDGPALHNLDLALMKNFHFSESGYFQLRGESFNTLNHVNLGTPNTSMGQSTTGMIFSAGRARVVQFGIKALF